MQVEKIVRKEVWESLQEMFGGASFLQSWEWGNFQEHALGKKVHRLGFYDHGDLIGVTLVIEEQTRFGTYAYLPRGPVINWRSDLWQESLSAIIDHIRGFNLVSIRFDPAIRDNDINQYKNSLRILGARKSKILMQVERAWVLDLQLKEGEKDLFDAARRQGMHKKLPGEIRRSEKKGLKIKISNEMSDIAVFHELLEGLSKRLKFAIRPKEYYEGQFKYLAPTGKERVIVASFEDKLIAAALIAYDKNEGSYLHAAALDEHRNLYAPSAIVWKSIEHAADLGCKRFNFWGVISDKRMENTKDQGYGYSKFKKRFGGHVEEYIGTWDMPLKKSSYLPLSVQDLYRNIRAQQ